MNCNNIFENRGFPRGRNPHIENLWIRWINVLDQQVFSGGSQTGIQVYHLKIPAQKYHLVPMKSPLELPSICRRLIHFKVKVLALSMAHFEDLEEEKNMGPGKKMVLEGARHSLTSARTWGISLCGQPKLNRVHRWACVECACNYAIQLPIWVCVSTYVHM